MFHALVFLVAILNTLCCASSELSSAQCMDRRRLLHPRMYVCVCECERVSCKQAPLNSPGSLVPWPVTFT